jgi:hypothetical protein
MKINECQRRWLIGISLIVGLPFHAAWTQDSFLSFPFDSSASVAEADLSVRVKVGEGSKSKSGVRNISAIGMVEANVEFDRGEPVAIQPRAIVVTFGRRESRWSFLFKQNEPPLAEDVPISRGVGVRGLSLSSVNESGLPWFPINDSGEFTMPRVEFEAMGTISVEGSGIESGTTNLADQWSFDLDLEGRLLSVNDQLQMNLGIQHTFAIDESMMDASLKLGGTMSGTASHPFARRILAIEFIPIDREIKVSWKPAGEFILLQDSSSTFSNPTAKTILSNVTELRFPILDNRSFYFQTQNLE